MQHDNDNIPSTHTENPWQQLRHYTDARIGLGRAGISIPTSHMLAFELAHAKAQDAVHEPLDIPKFTAELKQNDFKALICVHSQAKNRDTYLQRPDLGRRLDSPSCETLQSEKGVYDLSIIIADGLSSQAINNHAIPFLVQLRHALDRDAQTWNLAPLVLVQQGRVAIGDEVGEILNAKMTLILIGERPGLSSPDSLGLYLTWHPKIGTTDVDRNCISNIRTEGLSPEKAAQKALYLLRESRRLQLSGVQLKDRTSEDFITGTIYHETQTTIT
ncbi:ethanolamine ammonia-lyase subunit EutC [Sulfurospirillum sp. 1612]|uniref:ethanolamine ammonia-lyase subunit EutC n=1 Tax=Sulfurospirillum sp. 1612 TaxID=3094835 RepID=UPI002F95F53A